MKIIIHLVFLFSLFCNLLIGQIIDPLSYQCNAEQLLQAYEAQQAKNPSTESALIYVIAKTAYKVSKKDRAKELLQNIIEKEQTTQSQYYFLAQFQLYFYYEMDLNLDQIRQEITIKFGTQHDLLPILNLIEIDRKYRTRVKVNLDSLIPATIAEVKAPQLFKEFISINLQNLSKYYSSKGKTQKGLEAAQQLHKFVRQYSLDCDQDFRGAYISLGRRFQEMVMLDSALFYFEKAHRFSNEFHSYSAKSKITTAINLAEIWDKKGFPVKGFKYLKEAEATIKNSVKIDYTLLATTYNNMGLFQTRSGNREKAIEFFRKSALASENASTSFSIQALATNFNTGNQFVNLQEYQYAEKYLKKALTIAEQLYEDDHLNTARVLMALGSLYYHLDDVDQAKRYFDQSLRIRKKLYGDAHSSIGNLYANYALLYRDAGQNKEALAYIDQAIQAYYEHVGSKHPSVARAYLSKARIEVKADNYPASAEAIQKAKDALNCDDQYKLCSNYLLYLDIVQYEAILRWHDLKNNREGKPLEVINAFEHAFAVFQYALKFSESLVDAAALSAEYSYFFDFHIEALIHFAALENNDSYLTKAYQLNTYAKNLGLKKSLNQRTQLLFSNVPQGKRKRLSLLKGYSKNVEQKLLASNLSDQPQQKSLLDSLDKINSELTLLQKELESQYPSFEQIQKSDLPLDTEYLPSNVDSKTAILDFRLVDSTLFTFTLYEGNIEVSSISLNSSFEQQLDIFINSINYPLKESPPNDFLIPLLKAFENLDKRINRLVIIPDKILASLPFELLKNSKGLLLKQYAITYANSASIYNLQKAIPRHDNPISFAGFAPQYPPLVDTLDVPAYAALVRSGNWSLPYAMEEVQYISSFWKNSRSYLGKEATKVKLLDAIENSSILHLSMHAEANLDIPLNSRFIFNTQNDDEEQDLLLYELYNLNARSEMVVLSACETGRGSLHRGEGVRSLGNGFLYAGVPSVVMSLWKVPDESTSKIMKAFYQYLEEGWTKDVALQQAKLDYLNNSIAPELQAPYYWAGFILSGDEAPIMQTKSWSMKTIILFSILFIILIWWYSRKHF